MELRKKQRNDVFRALVTGKLDPATCEIESISNGFSLIHLPTQSRFEARLNPVSSQTGYRSIGRVGNDPQKKPTPYLDWATTMEVISEWSEEVVEWEGIPDLWETRHDWKQFAGAQGGSVPNTLFSQNERQVISSQLKAIKEAVKNTYELTEAQEARIDEQFKEAEEASERLGRKDWILLFIGTAFSLVLTDVITPDIFQHILMMAFSGLEHLFIAGQVHGALSE